MTFSAGGSFVWRNGDTSDPKTCVFKEPPPRSPPRAYERNELSLARTGTPRSHGDLRILCVRFSYPAFPSHATTEQWHQVQPRRRQPRGRPSGRGCADNFVDLLAAVIYGNQNNTII